MEEYTMSKDDMWAEREAQAADAAKQAHQREMNARPVVTSYGVDTQFVDREKLIKHLAFYYGLPVEEMKKVAKDVS